MLVWTKKSVSLTLSGLVQWCSSLALAENTQRKKHNEKTCVLSVLIFTDFVAGGGVNNEVTRSVKGKERKRGEKRGIEEVAPPTLILLLQTPI